MRKIYNLKIKKKIIEKVRRFNINVRDGRWMTWMTGHLVNWGNRDDITNREQGTKDLIWVGNNQLPSCFYGLTHYTLGPILFLANTNASQFSIYFFIHSFLIYKLWKFSKYIELEVVSLLKYKSSQSHE